MDKDSTAMGDAFTRRTTHTQGGKGSVMAMVPMDTTTLLEAKSESRGGCRPEGEAVGGQGRCRQTAAADGL